MSEAKSEASALSAELASTLPWHVGFHNEIADNMARYKAVNICANNGMHVAWARSAEHAEMIVEAVNKMANDKPSLDAPDTEKKSEHGHWNTEHFPGTRQICCVCHEPTGRCEEDALYADKKGPLCDECYDNECDEMNHSLYVKSDWERTP